MVVETGRPYCDARMTVIGAELHGKTARGRHERDLVAENLHDVVAVGGEADDDEAGAGDEDPDGDGRLLARNLHRRPDLVDRRIRADGVRDVVGAVGKAVDTRREDLNEREAR